MRFLKLQEYFIEVAFELLMEIFAADPSKHL